MQCMQCISISSRSKLGLARGRIINSLDIQNFEIVEYINSAKGHRDDPFNLPKKMKLDHASIMVKYNNNLFISDPTWAGGSSLEKFNPSYFLNPIEVLLNSQFSDDLNLNLKYSKFQI